MLLIYLIIGLAIFMVSVSDFKSFEEAFENATGDAKYLKSPVIVLGILFVIVTWPIVIILSIPEWCKAR